MCKTAIILAGGLGKRLEHHTVDFPKPLLPVCGVPMLEVILQKVAKSGYQRVILAVYYKSDLIKAFCGDGSKWGLSIEYSLEEKQLGTIGPIKQITTLPDNFLIINSDVLTDLDLGRFFDFHLAESSLFTIAYFERCERQQFGVLEIENQRLVDFKEKPVIKSAVNMGIYMANKKILDYIPENAFYALNDLIAKLLDLNEPISVFGHQGEWLDIGTLQTYSQAQLTNLASLV